MNGFNLDLTDATNLQNFSGVAPLFPLATVVFFPNTLLPLHVFEPRYRQMVNDVMNAERVIGMVLLKPGWEKNYQGSPDIYGVACMGKVVSAECLEDGRFNIVLYGLKRVKILETVKELSYRLVRVGIMEDVHAANEEVYRERIAELVLKWNRMLGKEHEPHRINIDTTLPIENLTDAFACSIISNIFEKQELLEETNVLKRAEKVISYLETRIQVVSLVQARRELVLEKRNLN